ncbi:hypothetical protein AOA12_10130 [Microbacterium sp. No. 7]|nr:hypothetical protein AOA12_10130 [Microbacterium sp. No. 7]
MTGARLVHAARGSICRACTIRLSSSSSRRDGMKTPLPMLFRIGSMIPQTLGSVGRRRQAYP